MTKYEIRALFDLPFELDKKQIYQVAIVHRRKTCITTTITRDFELYTADTVTDSAKAEYTAETVLPTTEEIPVRRKRRARITAELPEPLMEEAQTSEPEVKEE